MVDRISRFDEILDDCINRITLRGETIESCLVRYPEHASELEPYLRTTEMFARAYSFTPGGAAKEHARQRLQAERVALRRAGRQRGSRRASWRLGWMPRWAATAVVAVLVVLASSVGTVAASSNALPGDTLYPVKRGAEQVHLSFRFSPEDKARLNLEFAQRRAGEMASLMKEGAVPQLASLRNDLRQNLDTAARVINSVANEEAKAGLTTQFQQSAMESLGNLQSAAQQAPENSRQEVMDTLRSSSWGVGMAVEAVTAKPVVVAMAPGILQLMATDPPPPDVEKVLVTVRQIEVFLSAGENSRWITIAQEPQTFDLLRIAEVQKFLGQQQVDPGTYTKVRFLISEATVVVKGVERPAQVPADSFSLVRPFIVEEGKTTSVLLDFDGARSLNVTGQDQFVMTPVVNVMVRWSGEREGRGEKGRSERDRERGPEKPRRAEFEGRVDSVAADHIVIRGVAIGIAPTTRIEGTVEPGQKVEVEVLVQPDGSFLATKVEGEKRGKSGESESRGPEQRTVEIAGAIQSVSAGEWTIDGHKVKVTAETEIKGQASVGSSAKVKGSAQPDGSILAKEIEVRTEAKPDVKEEEKGKGKESDGKEKPARTPTRFSGLIEKVVGNELTIGGKAVIITSDTKIDGVPGIGASIEVEGQLQPDGKVLATSVKVSKGGEDRKKDEDSGKGPSDKSGPSERQNEGKDNSGKAGISFTGAIEKLAPGGWTVDGREVVIGPGTKVEGSPAVGLQARIEGHQQPDGKVLAETIQVRGKSGDRGKGESEDKKAPDSQSGKEGQSRTVESFSGTIENVGPSQLTVGGRVIAIGPQTKLEGTPAVGLRAVVEGQRDAEGKLIGISIKVSPRAEQPAAKDGDGNRDGDDDKPKPKGAEQNARPAEKSEDDKAPPAANPTTVTGTITLASRNQLTVAGKSVIIGPQTQVTGVAAPGRNATVKGRLMPNGSIAASSIEIIRDASD
ncbi:MAG: DUF4382 domain-containing protein [Chloroflexi bacterium]|nr:DUF4382 domain-containing protein [Chloroflexota bacterium]